jgi:hypothetical protein
MPAAAVVNGDAHWGDADAVLAARRGGGRTKPCAAHPATKVVQPVAVIAPTATPTPPRAVASSVLLFAVGVGQGYGQ